MQETRLLLTSIVGVVISPISLAGVAATKIYASDVRGVPLNGYIIFYRVTEEAVTIVRVMGGYQNLDNLSLGDDEFLEPDDK